MLFSTSTLAIALRPLDGAVLVVYLALLIVVAIVASRQSATSTRDYFLGSRQMPVWAVVFSTLATVQSAATFIGVPAMAYAGNLTYWTFNLAPVLAAVIAGAWFIPAYWRAGVQTPYELLETRFGPVARRLTSLMYLIGQVMGNGARTFIGCLPISLAIFGSDSDASVVATIALVMVVSTMLTLLGGVRSVIWIDVLQVVVYLGAAIAAVVLLLQRIEAPISQTFEALHNTRLTEGAAAGTNKLTILDSGVTGEKWWLRPQTLLTTLTGYLLLNLAVQATNQDFVQRSLACRDASRGSRSLGLATLLNLVSVGLFLVIGLLLYVYYQRPELAGGAGGGARVPPESSKVFQTFIFNETPAGLAGLMIAGVLAAGPAGINATLNSMGSTILNDLYRPFVPGRDERHYLRAGRVAVAVAGLTLGCFAALCVRWQHATQLGLVDFALNVMGFAYAGLLGVFTAALFTRRGNAVSAVASLMVGAIVMVSLDPTIYKGVASLLSIDAAHRWSISGLRLAYPWHMCLGFSAAFLVCSAVPGCQKLGVAPRMGST